MDREDQRKDEGDCAGNVPALQQEIHHDRAPAVEQEIGRMEYRRIQSEDQMLDLVGKECQRNVELRIIRCEDCPHGIRGKVKDEGIVVDKDVVVPGDEVVAEGLEIDCEGDQEKEERGEPRAETSIVHEWLAMSESRLSGTSRMVPPAGIEPTTSWFEARRSIQLSYEGSRDILKVYQKARWRF